MTESESSENVRSVRADKTVTPASFPSVVQYEPEYAHREFDGYQWLQLADIPSLVALLHGGTEKRALVCKRCGAFVAFPELHDDYHRTDGGSA